MLKLLVELHEDILARVGQLQRGYPFPLRAGTITVNRFLITHRNSDECYEQNTVLGWLRLWLQCPPSPCGGMLGPGAPRGLCSVLWMLVEGGGWSVEAMIRAYISDPGDFSASLLGGLRRCMCGQVADMGRSDRGPRSKPNLGSIETL